MLCWCALHAAVLLTAAVPARCRRHLLRRWPLMQQSLHRLLCEHDVAGLASALTAPPASTAGP